MDTVEVESGRDSFDGNHTKDIVSWLIPYPGQPYIEMTELELNQLMGWTMKGHLAWVVFPIDNF